MTIRKKLAVFTVVFASFSGDSLAQEVTDLFGQSIDLPIQVEVTSLKKQRQQASTSDELQTISNQLTEVVQDHPDYYRAWYNLGLTKLKQFPNEPEKFMEPFEKAIDLKSNNSAISDGSIHNTVGWALLENKRYNLAEKQFFEALEKASTVQTWTASASNYNLGRLYFETQQFDKARQYLDISAQSYGNPAAFELIKNLEKIEPSSPN